MADVSENHTAAEGNNESGGLVQTQTLIWDESVLEDIGIGLGLGGEQIEFDLNTEAVVGTEVGLEDSESKRGCDGFSLGVNDRKCIKVDGVEVGDVGTGTASLPEEEVVSIPLSEANQENEDGNAEKENEGAVEVGFLVDKINTVPYLKAMERGEVPFCAFSPISTDDLFLLRIKDCSDDTRHMLVPANKDEVFSTPGAVKNVEGEQEPGNENVMNYKVAIVAIARQVYSDEQKQLLVSVDPLLKKDKKKINWVKFLSLDKFADFAFAGFDGNVSDFVKKCKTEEKPNPEYLADQDHVHPQNETEIVTPTPPPQTFREKSPPKLPSRRGRGGRRGGRGRKSPSMSSHNSPPSRRGHHHRRGRGGSNVGCNRNSSYYSQQHASSSMFQQQHHSHYSSSFQPTMGNSFLSNDCGSGFVKVENFDGQAQTQQYVTQIQVPMSQMNQMQNDQMTYGDQIGMPLPFDIPMGMPEVPMPFSEVTVGQTGAEIDVPPPNHDIFTIAIDQLMSLTGNPDNDAAIFSNSQSVSGSTGSHQPERGAGSSSRGGRRPGRKPGTGRKNALKDRLQEGEDNSNSAFGIMGTDVGVKTEKPKRRGRPPKNRVVMQISGQENENTSSMDGDFEDLENYEKRLKLQIFPDQ